MTRNVKPIRNVSQAIDALRGLKGFFRQKEWIYHKFPFGLWFRGHSRQYVSALQPRAFRDKDTVMDHSTGAWDETNVYEVLRLRLPLQRNIYKSAFDWLCLMQHYSLPTRLLDWSESILTALYFAANEYPDDDGELIALNAKRLNRVSKPHPTISTPSDGHVVIRAEMATTRSLRTLCNKLTVKTAREEERVDDTGGSEWLKPFCKPVAVFPNRLNERMTFQTSVFTLHGGKRYVRGLKKEYAGDLIPEPISIATLNDQCQPGKPLLHRCVVPARAKKKIIEELFILGIHEGTLFPEVERQASYLKKLWWYPDP